MTVVRGPRGDQPPIFYGVFLDVTDRKRMESELERLALYDPLTGLPNRALFTDRLRQALARRPDGKATAVYFLDLDRFKRINDSLGHARRRRGAARGRAPARERAAAGGHRRPLRRRRVHDPVRVGRRRARGRSAWPTACSARSPSRSRSARRSCGCRASIGVALAEPGERVEVERLIEDADAAMYRAKDRGGARAELFDSDMRERAVEAMTIEQELQRGARARRAAALLPAAGRPRRRGRIARRRGAAALGAPRARPARRRARSSTSPRRAG